ncbi:hypothetical protein LUZ60_013108 [Juncus effusus]|nr:hypothetical protein LUZ60_013108 [Juncus effusus]
MVPTENGISNPDHEIREIQETEASEQNNQTRLMDHIPIYRSNTNRHFHVPFIRKINWRSLLEMFKKWIKDPSNIAIFIWTIFVAILLFILLLLMTGILNTAIPSSSTRSKWTEVVNQILNALFTIMCLYQNPRLLHHLVLVLRWREKDREEVVKFYSKADTSHKPHERWHILFVTSLLNLTCLAQYFCCGLFWAYNRENRPNLALDLGYGIGLACPIVAGLYVSHSPLTRKRDSEGEEIDSENPRTNPTEPESDRTEPNMYNHRLVVTRPEWIGGLFDCWDDLTVFFLSSFCTFCVFGWNMERLGFGNMYVHLFTFMLLCIAPFFIFNVTALNIDDETIRYIVGISGIILCFLGLFYGGFWRIQMRKRFKLPGNPYCWARSSVTDCVQWLLCCPCSLAQEVRTGNYYDIEGDTFFKKVTDQEGRRVLVPKSFSFPPKIEPNGLGFDEGINCDSSSIAKISFERNATHAGNGDHAMRPPFPPLIQVQRN